MNIGKQRLRRRVKENSLRDHVWSVLFGQTYILLEGSDAKKDIGGEWKRKSSNGGEFGSDRLPCSTGSGGFDR